MKTAVVIGRFQTPALHLGYLWLLNQAYYKVKEAAGEEGRLLVILGYPEIPDERNVLPLEVRKEMIWESIPEATIRALQDIPGNDEHWTWRLDDILSEFPEPILFGSRDCFRGHYLGGYPFHEVPEVPGHSATKQREEMVFRHNEDFRKGIFYAFKHLKPLE